MRALLSISVRNFRSLRTVDVDLQDLSVLVGPNGAGKTNLLRVIEFLGDTARLDLAPAIEKHGGMDALTFRGEKMARRPAPRIEIAIKAVVTQYASLKAPDVYSLNFSQVKSRSPDHNPFKATVRSEDFQFKRTQGRGRRITVSGGHVAISEDSTKGISQREVTMSESSSALSTLQRLSEKEGALQVKRLASLFETFRVFEIDVNAAKTPSRDAQATVLASNASNLAAFLGYLQKSHARIFAKIEADLIRIVPGIRALQVNEQALGGAPGVVVSFREHGLRGTTYLSDASFGTVRSLALLAMLHDPSPPMLTCVEEIDHGLHPHALDILVDRLRDASSRTQLLIATHSPALVNRLAPSELIVCERDDESGESKIPSIDSETIQEMVNASNLRPGELWFSGALGGDLPG
jgi:predicted ATPase